jgi:alpha-galactosidase
MRVPFLDTTYVLVWRRAGDDAEVVLPIAHLAGREVRVDVLHGAVGPVAWDGAALRVTLPRAPAVLLTRLTV